MAVALTLTDALLNVREQSMHVKLLAEHCPTWTATLGCR